MKKILFPIPLAFLSLLLTARAQDTDSLLTALTTPATDYVEATFKATRILNGHSVEQMKSRQLDFRIHHRFGPVNGGSYELWGLDQSNVFFSLEYGMTDWLMLGAGRSTYEKTYSGFAQFRLWRQATGAGAFPFSISALAGIDAYTTKWPDPSRANYFTSRLAYTFQALVARKFSDELSLQITPSVIHRNLVPEAIDLNDLFAVGFGGRYKIASRISINAEYFLGIHPSIAGKSANPNSFSVGCDIETGGHVFQIMLTNSLAMIERGFIGETTESWSKGGIHLGFNISRVFTL